MSARSFGRDKEIGIACESRGAVERKSVRANDEEFNAMDVQRADERVEV